jgi:hypothetical protein
METRTQQSLPLKFLLEQRLIELKLVTQKKEQFASTYFMLQNLPFSAEQLTILCLFLAINNS